MITASQLARYIISEIKKQMTSDYLEEFDVTPLKLQKLLYYVQGYSLALTGKPAFSDQIEAWRYGPVVESVYQEYKKYNKSIIPYEEIQDEEIYDETLRQVVRLVLLDKQRSSGEVLARATHKEAPWRNAYQSSFGGFYTNEEIPENAIKDYFTCEIQKREEDYEEEDKAWDSIVTPVKPSELEAVLEEI